jgi:hypothetical protein
MNLFPVIEFPVVCCPTVIRFAGGKGSGNLHRHRVGVKPAGGAFPGRWLKHERMPVVLVAQRK